MADGKEHRLGGGAFSSSIFSHGDTHPELDLPPSAGRGDINLEGKYHQLGGEAAGFTRDVTGTSDNLGLWRMRARKGATPAR